MDAPLQTDYEQLIELFHGGRLPEMQAGAEALVARFPRDGYAWKLLGVSLQVQGKESLAALTMAAELLPEDAGAQSNLGNAHRDARRYDAALQCYRRAIAIAPDFVEGHFNLGNVLSDLYRFEEAAGSYYRAIELRPAYADALFNLGNTLDALEQGEAALDAYRRALLANPELLGAWINLADAQRKQRLFEDATASCQRALALQPASSEAHNKLGDVMLEVGELDRAVACFRRAIELDADNRHASGNLLFALNYHPELSGEAIFEAYREYDARFGLPQKSGWQAHGNDRNPARRLRIGYVSPDFRRHSSRHFLEPVLAHHDRSGFEIFAYAELSVEDEVSARYRSQVDQWIGTRGLSDDEMAQRIRADGIDVLVDLAGHTGNNRLRVFARKPAPVSVSWLGYGYTTGLSAIDYLLTDDTSAPAGSEGLFAEKPWRLATPGYAYRPATGMGEVGELPAGRKGHLTYGTLTRAIRINHRSIRVWSEILKRDREAHLVIDSGNYREEAQQEKLAQKFMAEGIERERLEIGYHSPPWDVLRGIDIGLDCFPHNSGTTLFESLYLGVPYITLAGRPSVGRIGSSVLAGVGHPEWIAGSEEEYIGKALALGGDREALGRIRAGLRGEMERSALMDEAGFTRRVEAAYRAMFERWARG